MMTPILVHGDDPRSAARILMGDRITQAVLRGMPSGARFSEQYVPLLLQAPSLHPRWRVAIFVRADRLELLTAASIVGSLPDARSPAG